jgi:hypothetical protein
MHGSESFDLDLNNMVEMRVNKALQSGEITSEYQLTKFMQQALTEEKGKLAKYIEKPAKKPPATNKPGKPAKVDLDPNKLGSDERRYYDFFMKKGMKSEAESFLKESLEG